MLLSRLATYPVKSLRGQDWLSASLEARGIAGDRRWMLVDERGRFLTRREVPQMALIAAHQTATGLTISNQNGSCHALTPDPTTPILKVRIWRDEVAVRLASDEANIFLSEALGRSVRLAHQFDSSFREIDRQYANPGDQVSLADGFPILITTTASLSALNARLAQPVSMDRFRPNLVIENVEPWAEDRWRRLRIGKVELRLSRPCSRCVIVTQDPDTGHRFDGNEPLTTLRAMGRFIPGGIIFGHNAIPERLGRLNVGDEVEVLEEDE